jgi:hypothetical protein
LSGAHLDVVVNGTIIATAMTNAQGVAIISLFKEPAGTVESINFAGDSTHALASTSVIAPLVGPIAMGVRLSRNQCFFQPSGSDQLCLTQSGDLVELDASGSTLFDAQVSGGQSVVLSSDGNLLVSNSAGQVIWSSRTNGLGVTKLTILSSGQVALLTSSNQVWWTSAGGSRGVLARASRQLVIPHKAVTLSFGQKLRAGDCLFSPSGAARACVTVSGNVVVTNATQTTVWSSRTSGSGVSLSLKSNGQLIIVNGAGKILWISGSAIKGARSVAVSNQGALHLVSSSSKTLWTSTKGH